MTKDVNVGQCISAMRVLRRDGSFFLEGDESCAVCKWDEGLPRSTHLDNIRGYIRARPA